MANVWQKAFQRIFWKNRPYTDTPLGESKLLPMDASIDTIDDRVVTLQSTKAEQSDFLTALKNIQYNPSTGVFTITKFNDSSFTIDTDIEKIAINFDYDDDPTSAHYQQLIITLDDGTVKYVDLSALITEYEFGNTSTINFTVSGSTGIVTANIINGSITNDHLAPSVTAAINAAVNSAEAHAEDSEAWARGTKGGTPVASTADQYHNNSKYYSELSDGSAEDSEAYAKGTRNGTAVSSDDPAYHNNAKYWSDQAVATLNNKVDKEAGKGLSSNDFTDALKDKLDGIETGAETNVQSDWNQSDSGADDFIKNKPTIPAAQIQSDWNQTDNTAKDFIKNKPNISNIPISGIGELNVSSSTPYPVITMNSGFNLKEGAYLSVKFNSTLTIPYSDPLHVYITVLIDGTTYDMESYIGNVTIDAGKVAIIVYDGSYLEVVAVNNSGGGHEIVNSSGTTLSQEPAMQFVDSHVTDDSVNDRTVVETFKAVTQSEYASETEDGAYIITDGDGAVIGDVSEDYVEVTADGEKTYAELLEELETEYDSTKVTPIAYIKIGSEQYNLQFSTTIYVTSRYMSNLGYFVSGSINISTHIMAVTYYKTTGTTVSDISNNVPTNGTKITLYYGNKKAVVDLQTTANRCLYDSNTTVKQKIDGLIKTDTVTGNIGSSGLMDTIVPYDRVVISSISSINGDLPILTNTSLGHQFRCVANSGSDNIMWRTNTNNVTIRYWYV